MRVKNQQFVGFAFDKLRSQQNVRNLHLKLAEPRIKRVSTAESGQFHWFALHMNGSDDKRRKPVTAC